jgi:peptidylprolyl isomerase
MRLRPLLAPLALALLTAPALAQTAPAKRPPAAAPAKPTATAAASQPAGTAPAAAEWRAVDAENVLLIDTTKGRIILELAPEAAPEHVKRIKQLTREKFFDGVVFHRVIDYFMAQTGDPLGTGEGQSAYPDLKGEFTFRRDAAMPITRVATPTGAHIGFLRSLPVATQPDALMAMTADQKVAAWGLYCPGVAGMARGEDPDSANSQFFLMRQTYPSLEKRYTVWGRVISGLDVVRRIKTGEPVVDPDRMTLVRVLADVPAPERPNIEVLSTAGPRFQALIEQARRTKGADFSACDIDIPVRVSGGA